MIKSKRNKEKNKAYYEANKDRIKAKAIKHKRDNPSMYKKRRIVLEDTKRTYIREYKLLHPCITCGESDPIVLDFDHLDRTKKKYGVADMVKQGHSLAKVKEEIVKCQVLCANCHRRKTYYENNNKE